MNNTPIRDLALVTRRLGKPFNDVAVADGARAYVWELDPDGDGVAVARSASGNQHQLLAQVDRLLEIGRHGLSIRELIVAPAVFGYRRFHERPDLLRVETAVEAGFCRWVAFTDVDRISREYVAASAFMSYLGEHDIELILTPRNGELCTFTPESFEVRLLHALASAEDELRLLPQRLARSKEKERDST